MKRWVVGTICLAALATVNAAGADDGPDAQVSDLAWMSGTWSGPMGPQTLEEWWLEPAGGSVAGMIRIRAGGDTSLMELIMIEETERSLVLRVRQFAPGFVARSEQPLTMKLVAIGERQASFEATSTGELNGLSYSGPDENSLNIDVETSFGAKFQINLKRNPPAAP